MAISGATSTGETTLLSESDRSIERDSNGPMGRVQEKKEKETSQGRATREKYELFDNNSKEKTARLASVSTIAKGPGARAVMICVSFATVAAGDWNEEEAWAKFVVQWNANMRIVYDRGVYFFVVARDWGRGLE